MVFIESGNINVYEVGFALHSVTLWDESIALKNSG